MSPAEATSAECFSLVLLQQQDQSWVLPAAEVLACRLEKNPSSTCLESRLVAASSLWPQASGAAHQPWQLLTFKGRQLPWQLSFQGELELIETPLDAIYPLPDLLEQRKTWPAIKALVMHHQDLRVLLDPLLLEVQALGR